MMAARYLKPGVNCLVIDAGTCMTYDYLGFDGFYGGGAITMGLDMRYKSLGEFTQKLPRLSVSDLEAEEMIGRDIGDRTRGAIHSGVLGGIFDELNARTDRFRQEFANSAIILTGGDADFLVKHIKNEIFVEPLLVHYGLYYALHSV
jgi:type III pantothenate kinase